MDIKRLLSILLLMVASVIYAFGYAFTCRCGSPSSGSVVSWVVYSASSTISDCCTATSMGFGILTTYTPDEGNTYSMTEQGIDDTQVRMSCCGS